MRTVTVKEERGKCMHYSDSGVVDVGNPVTTSFQHPAPVPWERCQLEYGAVSVGTCCPYYVTPDANVPKGNNESSLTTSTQYLTVRCIADGHIVANLLLTAESCSTVDVKGKAVPLHDWSCPELSRKLRFPDFMTTAQDGGKVVSLTHRPHLPPGNTPGTHFC